MNTCFGNDTYISEMTMHVSVRIITIKKYSFNEEIHTHVTEPKQHMYKKKQQHRAK